MSEKPIEAVAEEVAPDEAPDPEEYHADDDPVSEATGTVYAATGEADVTPHDELPEDPAE